MLDVVPLPAAATERPATFPARGLWAAPSWVIVLLSVSIAMAGIAYLVVRARRSRRP